MRQIDYTANSNLLASVSGPVHTVTNTWEPARNVLASKKIKVGTNVISSFAYTVNPLGQRERVIRSSDIPVATSASWDWGYDSLGQVISADSSVNTSDRVYQFDAIGNRKKSADRLTLPGVDNYASNTLNQYSVVNSESLSYDEDGNATAYPLPAAPTANSTLIWDAENRLISTTVGTTTKIALYDSQSRRIAESSTINNQLSTISYLYDGWNCIAEYRGSVGTPPVLSKTRLWGSDLSGSLQGAGGVGGLLCESQILNFQITNYFAAYVGNGNVSEYLTSNGSVAAHFEYDPFGSTVTNTDTDNLFLYRFSTKPLDFATGFYYYGYRYYDPLTGGWSSRDPIEEEGGMNLYGFVGNSGINDNDILGAIFGWFDGWSKKGTNEDKSRRYWARKDSTISMDDLAKAVGLNAAEWEKWAKSESHDKCGLKDSDTGCCFSVPNTYVVANLLQGGVDGSVLWSLWSNFVNIGGVVGEWSTFTQGKKRIEPKTAQELLAELKSSNGSLLGIVIFAHGDETGYIGDFQMKNKTSQGAVMDLVKANGYQIKTADLMQCYSGVKIKDSKFSWRDKWAPLVYGRLRTYSGMNSLGIDTHL